MLTLNGGMGYKRLTVSSMKKILTILALLAALARPAQADFFTSTYNSGFANNGNIPDGSMIGMQDTRTVSGVTFNSISDVDVRLTISGSWNGDLYGYLVHDSGRICPGPWPSFKPFSKNFPSNPISAKLAARFLSNSAAGRRPSSTWSTPFPS